MALILKTVSSIFLTFLMLSLLSTPVFAAASEYRQCGLGETCKIGEFLFDDNYAPITTGATCTFTARDPAGNPFLSQPMTAGADGWYSYDVNTTGYSYGLYRGQICCVVGTETICLDKSFEVSVPSSGLSEAQVANAVWDAQATDHNQAGSFGENTQTPNLTADDIWTHPQRTLSSFGTLVSDIWAYSTRSLNSFSSLISGIWSNSERKLTGTELADNQELATKSQTDRISGEIKSLETKTTTVNNVQITNNQQLTTLSEETKANRALLEGIVNAPVVETFFDEGGEPPVDLLSKIEETKKLAQVLSSNTTDLQKQVASLNNNWKSTDYKIALGEVNSASRVLGATTEDTVNPDSINSRIDWLKQKWKAPVISNLSVQTESALANINSINREIKSYGKTFISEQYLGIATEHVDKLQEIIGTESDPANQETLFGYIADLERVSETLTRQSLALDELLEQWHKLSNDEKDLNLAKIKDIVLSVNKITNAELLLKPRQNDEKYRENLALTLKGLIETNLIFLAHDSDKVTQNIWLEHGSVIFRSVAINPSNLIAQKVKVQYYLPQEITPEDIINLETGLEVKLDTEKNTYYVTGEFLLQPEEAKTIVVEVADVWVVPAEEIASMRKQAETLFEALKNTSYFAQGATIKADIDVNLDKIELLTKNNQTPEAKIRAYREATLEMQSAKSKLEALKTIVNSAGSISTVFGFVGGVQAIAVWGLIIILIIGFVFLAIYFRLMFRPATLPKAQLKVEDKVVKKVKVSDQKSCERLLAKSENMSILSLIREIIALKMSNSRSGAKNSSQVLLMFSTVIIIVLLIVVVFLLIDRTQFTSELISPLPADYAEETVIAADPTTIAKKVDTTIALTQTPTKGLVLGAKTKPSLLEDEQPTGTPSAVSPPVGGAQSEKRLVKATIPEGYQAINVRIEPNADSQLSGRLYVNQNVYLLEEKDGWALIETNYVDDTRAIVGWVLANLISDLE